MEFFRRASGYPRTLAIFSAAFHPPTIAHRAIVEAALRQVDEVLIVLPRTFPHKAYDGLGFELRLRMAEMAFHEFARCSIAAADRGLFIDLAREAKEEYPGARLFVLVGRDAAERIVNWDYGEPGAFEKQLEVFELLVAFRGGYFEAPERLKQRVHHVDLPEELSSVSSTEVRLRIQRGDAWQHLVPDACVPLIEMATSSFSL